MRKRPREDPVIVRVACWDIESTDAIPPSRDLTRMRISVASVMTLDGEDDILNFEKGTNFKDRSRCRLHK